MVPQSWSSHASAGTNTSRSSCRHGELVPWPGPDPAELAEGSLVVSATVPRSGVVVVRAVGEIDLLTAPGWRRVLTGAVRVLASETFAAARPGLEGLGWDSSDLDGAGGPAARPVPRLVCDLSPVTFLGASGLGVLVDLAVDTAQAGIALRVVAGNRRVDRALHLTMLDRRLAIHRRLEHAVSADPLPGAP